MYFGATTDDVEKTGDGNAVVWIDEDDEEIERKLVGGSVTGTTNVALPDPDIAEPDSSLSLLVDEEFGKRPCTVRC